ncbi:MAG: SGNH/GDSL hydrolase family protein [Lachnospiraceae bacterium]|nr:SGNH/GDSL hydrolase family protein [Lachnospiraceae bacterium]
MKNIKILLIVLVSVLVCNFSSTGAAWIVDGGIDTIFGDGPGDGELVVAGDSYAEAFYKDEKDRGMELIPYYQEGYTIEANRDRLRTAFYSVHKYILFSISVNDHRHNTHPNYFEEEYLEMIALAIATQKTVFVHSYMIYDWAASPLFNFTPYNYDDTVRKIANDYDNIYYIDMTDCIGKDFIKEDGIHYNKRFNDILYDRIKAKINELKAMKSK